MLTLILAALLAHPGGRDSNGCHAGTVERHCHEPAAKRVSPLPVNAPCAVTRVVDADTIDVTCGDASDRVRLRGLACPESRRNAKCMRQGAEACELEVRRGRAAAMATWLVLDGATVTLEPDSAGEPLGVEVYGRTLAYVHLVENRGARTQNGVAPTQNGVARGRDVGEMLIRAGFCEDSARYPHPRREAYRGAMLAIP